MSTVFASTGFAAPAVNPFDESPINPLSIAIFERVNRSDLRASGFLLSRMK